MSEPAELPPLLLPADDSWVSFVGERADHDLARARELLEHAQGRHQRGPPSTSSALERRRHRAAQRQRRWSACSPRCIRTRRFARSPRSASRTISPVRAPNAASTASCTTCWRPSTPTDLDADAPGCCELTLRDFRRSGVDRDDDVRDRLREIAERAHRRRPGVLAATSATTSARSGIAPDRLAGLPQDFVDAHPADADGLVTHHHRLPRRHPVPHVRPRRRRAPRTRHRVPEPRPGPRTTPLLTTHARPARRAGRAARLRRAGRTSTPRSR